MVLVEAVLVTVTQVSLHEVEDVLKPSTGVVVEAELVVVVQSAHVSVGSQLDVVVGHSSSHDVVEVMEAEVVEAEVVVHAG